MPEILRFSKSIDYPAAVAGMEARVAQIIEGKAHDQIWFLEHPPTYTAGTSAKVGGLKAEGLKNVAPANAGVSLDGDPGLRRDDTNIPLYETGRGGEHTYHGPGQLVVYPLLTLKNYYPDLDLRRYVHDLEEWIIRTLAAFGVVGERRAGRIGIWVVDPAGQEAKIAAIGIRVRRGVAFHGLSININPNLIHYDSIVPCGIQEFGVTSLAALGMSVTRAQVEEALRTQFSVVFGGNVPNFVETDGSVMMS
jgi:lipoyl(octanoyl) transferase